MARMLLPRNAAAISVALALPFYVNDFANIFVTSWAWWLAIDYVFVKALPVAVILWVCSQGLASPADFGWRPVSAGRFAAAFLFAATAGTLIDQNAYELTKAMPGYRALGGMPAIGSRVWDWIDLTLGLFLVGCLEEVIFRAWLHRVVSGFTDRAGVHIAASALAFGLIHWSLGLQSVLVTGVIGALFMAIYLRVQVIAPIALAHFAVNFIDFADVIPKSIFKLL